MGRIHYRKRRDESLAQWCERIAAMCQGRPLSEAHEMVSEVSKASYIEGVHAALTAHLSHQPH